MAKQKKRPNSLVFLLAFILISFTGNTQILHRKINRLDEKGCRQGIWIIYLDSARRQPLSKFHFKDGREYRTSRYYHENGTTRVKFRYKGESLVLVKYYDTCGRLTQKGRSLMLYTDKEIRYCWDGAWKFYDNRHRLIRTAEYRKGEELGVEE